VCIAEEGRVAQKPQKTRASGVAVREGEEKFFPARQCWCRPRDAHGSMVKNGRRQRFIEDAWRSLSKAEGSQAQAGRRGASENSTHDIAVAESSRESRQIRPRGRRAARQETEDAKADSRRRASESVTRCLFCIKRLNKQFSIRRPPCARGRRRKLPPACAARPRRERRRTEQRTHPPARLLHEVPAAARRATVSERGTPPRGAVHPFLRHERKW